MAPFAPPVPEIVREHYAEHASALQAYADLLADAGVVRGLIGPREVDRLWERHILNCAVMAPAVRPARRLVDVGSGAGLPGLVLAILLPEVAVTLLEPMLRRVTFLEEAAAAVGPGHVRRDPGPG